MIFPRASSRLTVTPLIPASVGSCSPSPSASIHTKFPMSAVGTRPASIVRSSPALASNMKGSVSPLACASLSVPSLPLSLAVKPYSVVPAAVVGSNAILYVPDGIFSNK